MRRTACAGDANSQRRAKGDNREGGGQAYLAVTQPSAVRFWQSFFDESPANPPPAVIPLPHTALAIRCMLGL